MNKGIESKNNSGIHIQKKSDMTMARTITLERFSWEAIEIDNGRNIDDKRDHWDIRSKKRVRN